MTQKKKKLYQKIKDKYIHVVPNYSIVGMILFSEYDKNLVISSPRKDAYAHSLFNWEIKDNELVKTDLSKLSKNFNEIENKKLSN